MEAMVPYAVVRFAAIECRLQMSGEMSVLHMVNAMLYAEANKDRLPTVDDVLTILRLVEPVDNANGFRRCTIHIGYEVKENWWDIPRQMVDLCEALREGRVTAEEFSYEFLVSHPGRDGNGRSSQVLYAWITGNTSNPVWHKNFWSDPRRTVDYGA